VLPRALVLPELAPTERVVARRDGLLGTVTVVEERDGSRVLWVDHRFQMGGTQSAESLARHAHLPLLLHPAPKRVVCLGLGTGITLGAATLHVGVEAEGVELVPEVVSMLPWFAPENRGVGKGVGRVRVADARRHLWASGAEWDVVVADLFHPARDGAALLYTREHFEVIRRRLAPSGLFCQWLPLHQMDDRVQATVIRTFLDVFPEAELWLLRWNVDTPVAGLIGRVAPRSFEVADVEGRLVAGPLLEELKRLGWADRLRVRGQFLAGPTSLREFAGAAPMNTDDRPVMMFLAPAGARVAAEEPWRQLEPWLGREAWRDRDLREAMPGLRAEERRVLERYLLARDVYLRGLIDEGTGREMEALEAFVESARISAEFTSGYAHCLSRAAAMAGADRPGARALLERLIEARPERPVAAELLRRL
jgi:spermidine synthase